MKAVLITSSILIVLIAALRPVLRGKIDPRVQYALWLAAVLRLLIPVNFVDSAYSALALLERAEQPSPIAETIETIGQTTLPIPAMSREDAYDLALQEYGQDRGTVTGTDDFGQVEALAQELLERELTLSELAAKCARPVWLGGAAVMGLWFLLVNLRLRRKLRWALPVEADCPLPVYVTPELPSPCLCGVVRPAIYVTPAALESPERLRHVLVHELTHCRHRDHWWALVRCLCLCVYWFDPLVWWAAALSRQDCELACDEGAIRRLGEGERLAYGRTLVDMIAAGRTSLLQTATTMTGGKRRVRERIQLIARRPKTVIAAALALAVVLGLAVGCTFTGAPEGSPEPDPSTSLVPDAPQPALDTLRERLGDIPEDLRSTVVDRADLFDDTGVLASYWWEAPIEWVDDMPWPMPWLLSVHRWDQERLDAEGYPASHDTSVLEIFARDEEWYYVTERPSDARFEMDDLGLFADLYAAARDFAMQTVLDTEGVEPFSMDSYQSSDDSLLSAQQNIQIAVDRLMVEPTVEFTLTRQFAESDRSYQYSADPSQDFFAYYLRDLPTMFRWEDAPYSTSDGGASLRVASADGTVSLCFSEGSFLVLVGQEGRTRCYKGQYEYGGADDYNPFDYIRNWYGIVELNALRTCAVPDRGQSHEDVVKEWVEGYEGAYTKCAPDGPYTCTYIQAADIKTDLPEGMTHEELENFARNSGYSADDFGKTWFVFGYSLIFVPENQNAKEYLITGNTEDYTGTDAPEGAQIYYRVGYMDLIDGNWICKEVGTSW